MERSNAYAQILIGAEAPFRPESFSKFGVAGYDDRVADLRADNVRRFRAAVAAAKSELHEKLNTERDPNVREDLEIMIATATDDIESSELQERLVLPWQDVSQLVFEGLRGLLSEQTPPERRGHALDRLKRYAGLAPGTVPLMTLAIQRYEERVGDGTLLRPSRPEVEQALRNADTYMIGIRKLFIDLKVSGAEDALDALDKQTNEYTAWLRSEVLPHARTDTRLPPALYADALKRTGVDIDAQSLIQRAELEFMETRAAMQQLAPLVAREKGIPAADYRDVIRALKKEPIPTSELESHYRKVIETIVAIIRKQGIVLTPNRPMAMRLGSDAENASQPAPHFLPAPLVRNTGQQGTFVLSVNNPALGADGAFDDFNYPSAAWTLAAHEGRPGHELQFTAMLERGVSLARALFAANSVNSEGWALYAEAEMMPYEPLDGQLIALQFRLFRAARAMLDPMLNLGLIEREQASDLLTRDAVLSKAMVRQELDRYTFNMPGQATSYFYGYACIMELRMETELTLGNVFDRLAFNNFLLEEGPLPPALLAQAVRERFIPAQLAKR
ncbi:DUF885 domain-containing protein [Hyphomicrobium sp. 99]|uniref:DUF885 domain-containing protein n=1 Tax=Hyphomicrobium sp. 99 TaxID=1163419 RepID=UPI001AEBC0E0|nr:DUF885 domain-containing protein [Hyphomicrobium sp. 99]